MRRLISLAATLACLVAPSAADAAGGGGVAFTGGFLYDTREIPPNGVIAFRVTCPPPYRAFGGMVSTADASVLTVLSRPAALNQWSFGFRNTDPAKPAHVTVVVTCARPRVIVVKGKQLKVRIKVGPTKVVSVGRGGYRVVLTCPPKAQGVMGTIAPVNSVTPRGASAAAPADILRSAPSGSGWAYTLAAPPGVEQTSVRVGAACLPETAAGGAARIAPKDRAVSATTARGLTTVGFSCAGGTGLPISGGYDLGNGTARLRAAVFGRGLPRLSVSDPVGGARIRLFNTCLPGSVRFVRGSAPVVTGQTITTTVGPIRITQG